MKQVSTFLFLLVLSLVNCIKLNNRNFSNKIAINAQTALERINSRVYTLTTDTSCKVAAKFALLAFSNVKSKDDLKQINRLKSIENILRSMRSLLLKGYVLQVEIKTNHHFILFMKNKTDIYLIQAFYTFYRLEDWLSDSTLMKPFLTIDDFFKKFRTILNPNTPKETVDSIILELFLPKTLIDDEEKQNKMIDYFNGKVTLVKVDYAPFDFGIIKDGSEFHKIFHQIDQKFFI